MSVNRDPFGLRRNSPAAQLFQSGSATVNATTAQASIRAVETISGSRKALTDSSPHDSALRHVNMSTYSLPNGGASNNIDMYPSSGRSRYHHRGDSTEETISEKVSHIFAGDRKDALPMYKDKPAHYRGPGGSRSRLPSWMRRKRVYAPALAGFALLSWWFGILSPLAWFSRPSNNIASRAGRSAASKNGGWFGSIQEDISWPGRAAQVKEAFKISFAGYEKYGWGYDEYHPVSHTGRFMVPKGMGWIIVDALDTMMIMNLTDELAHARQWIHSNLTYDQDHDVNTFETTIRMLGGLLSAHYLSTKFLGQYAPVSDGLSDDMYIEKATDLADRLLGAYETQSGVPLASVNLHTMQGIPSHADGGASSTAEATSLQLEMKYLAKLTGETHYWEKAEHVMKVLDDQLPTDGLVPIFIYADQGTFRGDNIRLGSRGDSYYEYLIKQYLQTSQQEFVYQAMWNESMEGIKKHLITYSHPNNFTVLAERPNGLNRELEAKMDHLVCFLPGTIALATTGGHTLAHAKKQPNWTTKQDEDMNLARELAKTCMGMYRTETGLAPEIAHFNLHNPPIMYNDFGRLEKPKSPDYWTRCKNGLCTETEKSIDKDYVFKPQDNHNLQRPETAETLFYMWRITGNEMYRNWGWDMFQAFFEYTLVEDEEGFSSISNVREVPVHSRDNMESFWLAETLKYFYLLFSEDDILPLTDVVFNTEAHPFPRFEMGKLFKTGWQRRKDGAPPAAPQSTHDSHSGGEVKIQTIQVTQTIQQEVVTRTVSDADKTPEPAKGQAAQAVITEPAAPK